VLRVRKPQILSPPAATPQAEEAADAAPIAPPPGLRVYRTRVRDTEYAVLAIPLERDALGEKLTNAERQVLALACQGLSNEAVAARRGTSPRTVANQLQSIYRKLGIVSRLELARGTAVSRRRRRAPTS
jgi:DNA-binding CsgD family transcriptional regulator